MGLWSHLATWVHPIAGAASGAHAAPVVRTFDRKWMDEQIDDFFRTVTPPWPPLPPSELFQQKQAIRRLEPPPVLLPDPKPLARPGLRLPNLALANFTLPTLKLKAAGVANRNRQDAAVNPAYGKPWGEPAAWRKAW